MLLPCLDGCHHVFGPNLAQWWHWSTLRGPHGFTKVVSGSFFLYGMCCVGQTYPKDQRRCRFGPWLVDVQGPDWTPWVNSNIYICVQVWTKRSVSGCIKCCSASVLVELLVPEQRRVQVSDMNVFNEFCSDGTNRTNRDLVKYLLVHVWAVTILSPSACRRSLIEQRRSPTQDTLYFRAT